MSSFKKNPVDKREMSEDWQVGDIAECIVAPWTGGCPHNPKIGDILIVSAINELVDGCNNLMIGLGFEGKPQKYRWDNTAFKKHHGIEQSIKRAAKKASKKGIWIELGKEVKSILEKQDG